MLKCLRIRKTTSTNTWISEGFPLRGVHAVQKKKKNKTAPKIAESQTRGCGVDSMGTMDFRF